MRVSRGSPSVAGTPNYLGALARGLKRRSQVLTGLVREISGRIRQMGIAWGFLLECHRKWTGQYGQAVDVRSQWFSWLSYKSGLATLLRLSWSGREGAA